MVVEADHVNDKIQTATSTPKKSTASSASSKTSLFIRKAGFVIPKNKLSGSLVPVIRGSKKSDGNFVNDEAVNVLQEKTKWGPDLTLDSSVRKGRASAYQTRITQISEQLASSTLETEDNTSFSATESQYGKKSDLHLTNEEQELLMLERREIIGELIKLNPAYKAPADYKPLMKEAKVPIHFKEHHGCNFIDSIFDPASDTLKKIEKDTGAKIKVYGIKSDTGMKVEINSLDGKEIHDVFEEHYALVSADSFDKTDAAVALVELLITAASVNPMSSTKSILMTSDDNVKTISSSTETPPLVGQELANISTGSLRSPQDHSPFNCHPWPPVGLNQGAPHSRPGLLFPNANSTVPMGDTVEMSPVHLHSSNIPSVTPSFVSVSSSVAIPRPQLPHGLQSPYIRQEPPSRNSQASLRLPPPIFSTPPQASPVYASNIPMPMICPRPPDIPPESLVTRGSLPLRPLMASGAAPSTTLSPPIGHMLMRAPSPDVITPRPAPTPTRFMAVTSRPLQPSTDFTFFPRHRQPAPPPPQVWQPLNLGQPATPPQSPFMRRPMPYDVRQKMINQPWPHTPAAFFAGTERPSISQLPPRHPTQHPRPFIPPVNNLVFPPSQVHHHHHAGIVPIKRFPSPMAHKQSIHPGRQLPGTMAAHQIHGPPTFNPQMANRPPMVQNDGDTEYEDLMASVGVK